MLKRDQILPYLDYCLRFHKSDASSPYVVFSRRSTCHRSLVLTLLYHHYSGNVLESISTLYSTLRFSPETIRRAVKDGIEEGCIEASKGRDRRYKRIQASQLLVESFEETHVESTE